MINVLIVDDHDLMRIGLQGILGRDDRIRVVGEAASGEDAVRLSRQLKPDVILMDLGLPGISGLESTERILKAQPQIRIVVLTAHSEPPLPARLLDSGASGYLTKACSADELVEAVHAVSRGERYIGANISQQLALSLLPGASKTPFQELTARELEVALMLMQGMKARIIGETLSISPKTVATYKYRVYEKIDVKNEVELLRAALRHGVVTDV